MSNKQKYTEIIVWSKIENQAKQFKKKTAEAEKSQQLVASIWSIHDFTRLQSSPKGLIVLSQILPYSIYNPL